MNYEEDSTCLEPDDTEIATVHRSGINDTDRVKMMAGKFILTLKEKFKLTQASLNYTIQTVNNITELSANSIKQSIMKELQESGGIFTPSLDQCFLPINPFDELHTEYQQIMFFSCRKWLIIISWLYIYSNFRSLHLFNYISVCTTFRESGKAT